MLRIFELFRNLPGAGRARLKLVGMTNNKLQMTNHGFRGSTSVILSSVPAAAGSFNWLLAIPHRITPIAGTSRI